MKTYYQLILEIRDYCPKNKRVTSLSEINMLDKHFGLSEMSEMELRNLRDMVVLSYDRRMGPDPEDDTSDNLMRAMMSITAVIDHFIFKITNHEEA